MPADTTPSCASAMASQAHGQDAIVLSLPNGSTATVLLHGAHVTSWHDAQWGEQLYLSPLACFDEVKAIRGGVPIIFPQFEAKGPDFSLPRHGFARTMRWQAEHLTADADHAQCTLLLEESAQTLDIWPHRFQLRLTVSLSTSGLGLTLKACNTDTHDWSFSAALHTYLLVASLSDACLEGLHDCDVHDAAMQHSFHETASSLTVTEYLDRIYHAGPRRLRLRAHPKTLSITAETFSDVVVWNPGAERCAAMTDMPSTDWSRMLCVEAAQIQSPPVLKPGQTWFGRQQFQLQQSTAHTT